MTTLNIQQPSDLYIQVKREKVEQSFCLRKELDGKAWTYRPGPPDPVEMLLFVHLAFSGNKAVLGCKMPLSK